MNPVLVEGRASAPGHRIALSLLDQHEGLLRSDARRYSLCADDADDVYQCAVEVLLTKAPCDDLEQLLPWMRTVIKREALGLRRRRERLLLRSPAGERSKGRFHDPFEEMASESTDPLERVERRERVERSAEALASLKRDEARALLLKAAGYTYAEIGEATGWTFTKVNRAMSEGRRRFLAAYERIENGDRCEELAEVLSAFAQGEANGSAQEMRRHLRGCARCRARLAVHRGLPRKVLGFAPALPVAQSWWQRLYETAVGGFGDRVAAGSTRVQGLFDAVVAQKATAAVAIVCAGAGGAACVATDLPGRLAEELPLTRSADRAASEGAGTPTTAPISVGAVQPTGAVAGSLDMSADPALAEFTLEGALAGAASTDSSPASSGAEFEAGDAAREPETGEFSDGAATGTPSTTPTPSPTPTSTGSTAAGSDSSWESGSSPTPSGEFDGL